MNPSNYILLPFNFERFNTKEILLVNDAGEFYFINVKDFDRLLGYLIKKNEPIYQDLKNRQFLAEKDDVDLQIQLLANKYRTRKRFLDDFTALHMMVITLRCNHRCRYCQVTSESQQAHKFDMSPETARRIIDYIFKSPSKYIKIEFQGGEPLINWNTVTEAVKYAEKQNETFKKKLEFVICTNLTLIDDEKAKFIKDHDISISTSLDGPKDLHDKNRILKPLGSSYELFVKKLRFLREKYKISKVSALMTTTYDSKNRIREIIDQYLELGLHEFFIRSLNPYGRANINKDELGYSPEEFLDIYNDALDYIILLNKSGTRIIEYYTALLLYRILTPFSSGFVDLQSPSGAGISGVIYDFNGDVYPADEARMLARMGNSYFKMGNVFRNTYNEIFNSQILRKIVKESCLEILPQCASCVYQAYCGGDPIRNYLETKDIFGHRPSSFFCKKHKGMFKILFNKIKAKDPLEMEIFWSWIN